VFDRSQLEEAAGKILARRPNAAVRVRLLRDVLGRLPDDPELRRARAELRSVPWVRQLAEEQLPDGSWGRFHSQDTKIKSAFTTSEAAIRRGLALGLERSDPVLAGAIEYMQAVLAGQANWTDRVEKAEGWPICVEAITAGTLAQVDPTDPSSLPAWEYWTKIASLSFPGGEYDSDAEWSSHKELRGLGTRYLGSRYVLTLLGARSRDLPAALDRQLAGWIARRPEGIGYLGAALDHPDPVHLLAWLETLEILALFRSRQEVAGSALTKLLDMRNPEGLWDFGSRPGTFFYFPLSDDWRKAGDRENDHSTRVLALLRKLEWDADEHG
jgi:hypothetical protein